MALSYLFYQEYILEHNIFEPSIKHLVAMVLAFNQLAIIRNIMILQFAVVLPLDYGFTAVF